MFRYRKLLLIVNRAVYVIAAAMLIAGLVLTVSQKPAAAAVGTVWTTDTSCAIQNKNSYYIGEQFWVRYAGIPAGTYQVTLTKVNAPNKGFEAFNINITVNGDNCVYIDTIQPTDPLGTYKFEIGPVGGNKIKSDNITLSAAPTELPTDEPTLPPTQEPTDEPTNEPTDPGTGGPDPTLAPPPQSVAASAVLIPVTGMDVTPGMNSLSYGGLGMLGFGLVLSGIRRKLDE